MRTGYTLDALEAACNAFNTCNGGSPAQRAKRLMEGDFGLTTFFNDAVVKTQLVEQRITQQNAAARVLNPDFVNRVLPTAAFPGSPLEKRLAYVKDLMRTSLFPAATNVLFRTRGSRLNVMTRVAVQRITHADLGILEDAQLVGRPTRQDYVDSLRGVAFPMFTQVEQEQEVDGMAPEPRNAPPVTDHDALFFGHVDINGLPWVYITDVIAPAVLAAVPVPLVV